MGKNKKYRSVGFSVGKRSAGLCPVTANCQPSQGQSERWFESQKFHSSDVSPLVVVSSFTLAGNGLGLCEVGAFKAQMFNLAQMFIRITNA